MEGVNDKEIFEKLSEQLGRPISSYDDLKPAPPPPAEPTAEEIEKARLDRENAKISWGLANNKISKEKYDSFIKIGSAEDLVFSEFAKNRKAEDDTLNDDDIKTEFKDIKSVMGEKVIAKLGESLLKQEYSEVFNIDREYTEHETNETKFKTDGPSVIAMNTEILGAIGSGITIELPAQEGREPVKVNFKPDQAKVAELLSLINNPEKVKGTIGKTKEQQEAILRTSLINADLSSFAQQIYEQAVFNKEALFRGIPQLAGKERTVVGENGEMQVEKNKKIFEEILKAKAQ